MGGLNLKLAKKIATLLLFGAVIFIFGWRLGTLTQGLSPAEAKARMSSQSWQVVAENPLNAPHKLVQLGFSSADQKGALWMRSVSAAFALLFLVCFYLLARLWFGNTIGLLASLLFASTPWLILLARNATPSILLLSPLAVMTCYSWLIKSNEASRWMWLALSLSIAISLYVPGVFWLILAGAIWTRKYLIQAFDTQKAAASFSLILLLLLISPLIWSMTIHTDLLKQWLLIPGSWPSATETLSSVGWAGLSIFWRLRQHLDFGVGRLPMLDIAQALLVVGGSFALLRLARRQMYGLLGSVLLAIALAGVNHDIKLLILGLPALGLIAGAGLRYLYLQWRQIFPFNPLPRFLAVFLLGLMILLNVIYGVRYSLAAWPHSLETRRTYVIK